MRALLDTCVLSELAKPDGAPAVKRQVRALGEEGAFVSVLSLGEIAKGVALLDEGCRKRALQTWLTGLSRDFGARLIGIDAETARIWGEMTAAARKRGLQVAAVDGLIAASALRHGLAVMTRNVADFEPTGARILDPWS